MSVAIDNTVHACKHTIRSDNRLEFQSVCARVATVHLFLKVSWPTCMAHVQSINPHTVLTSPHFLLIISAYRGIRFRKIAGSSRYHILIAWPQVFHLATSRGRFLCWLHKSTPFLSFRPLFVWQSQRFHASGAFFYS